MLVEDEQDRVFSHRWTQGGVVGVVTMDPAVGGGETGRGAGGEGGAIMGGRDLRGMLMPTIPKILWDTVGSHSFLMLLYL